MQGVTTFTGTMLEVKKTHVLAVLDLAQTSELKKFIKGVASRCHAFRACMHDCSNNHAHTHNAWCIETSHGGVWAGSDCNAKCPATKCMPRAGYIRSHVVSHCMPMHSFWICLLDDIFHGKVLRSMQHGASTCTLFTQHLAHCYV